MKSKRKNLAPAKYRRQYQRSFMHWLAKNREQFAVKPLKPRATVSCVYLRFPGMSSVISIMICANSIAAFVDWNERQIDRILDLDMWPIWNGSAYRCELCDESDETFPNLNTMRVDHLYAPFLEWCNEKFLTSRWLEIAILDCGLSSARLLREITDPKGKAILDRLSILKKVNGEPACRKDKDRVFHIPVFE